MEVFVRAENCVSQHKLQCKHGINAILSEVNDLCDLPKRSAHVAALETIQKQQVPSAKPREYSKDGYFTNKGFVE